MTHVVIATHEVAGNLIFCKHGLNSYWAISKLLAEGFDGSRESEIEIDGETWTLKLTYPESGIQPRAEDDVERDRLYECRIGAYGDGERKANLFLQPRFAEMRHYQTGNQISSPFDHITENEGVNVRFSDSDLEPDTSDTSSRNSLRHSRKQARRT